MKSEKEYKGIKHLHPTDRLLDPEAMDQDDMCIWVHPTDPGLSTIISSDKKSEKIFVYDLEGRTLQSIDHPKPGNIDVRCGFPLGDDHLDIVAFNQRRDGWKIVVCAVDPETRRLRRVDDGAIDTAPGYGGSLYRSPKDGRLYFIKTAKEATVEQYELFDSGDGRISGRRVRHWTLTICEGAVADDRTGSVYLAEENVGIWLVGGEPDDPTPGTLIARVGEYGLVDDIEGLTIYPLPSDGGYLLASNQGRDAFTVFDLGGSHDCLGSFTIEDALHTDGIDVCCSGLGPRYPGGLFACHTTAKEAGTKRCPVLITPWESIAEALGLAVDTSWNPRSPGTVERELKSPGNME